MIKLFVFVGIICLQFGLYQVMGCEIFKSVMMVVDEINDQMEFDFVIIFYVCDFCGIVFEYYIVCDDFICNVGVEYIIGCYILVLCKQVFFIVECIDCLFWYFVCYEGFECLDNVIYVGVLFNYNVLLLVCYVFDNLLWEIFCVGLNYVWIWEINCVICELVSVVDGYIFVEWLFEFGESVVGYIVDEIVCCKLLIVFNILVGSLSYDFICVFNVGIKVVGLVIFMLSCSLCELELVIVGLVLVGCIILLVYFESIWLLENCVFVVCWKVCYGEDSSFFVDG